MKLHESLQIPSRQELMGSCSHLMIVRGLVYLLNVILGALIPIFSFILVLELTSFNRSSTPIGHTYVISKS